MRDQVVVSCMTLVSVSGRGGRGGGGFEPPPPPLVRPVPVGLLQRGYFIHTFFVCITGFLFASWFTNDVRLFGFLYLFSVFLWNYVAVIVFIVVRGLPSALWLVGGSLVY